MCIFFFNIFRVIGFQSISTLIVVPAKLFKHRTQQRAGGTALATSHSVNIPKR